MAFPADSTWQLLALAQSLLPFFPCSLPSIPNLSLWAHLQALTWAFNTVGALCSDLPGTGKPENLLLSGNIHLVSSVGFTLVKHLEGQDHLCRVILSLSCFMNTPLSKRTTGWAPAILQTQLCFFTSPDTSCP